MGRGPAPQASSTRFLRRPEAPCMSPLELRASLSLASLFALRMLGLFLILPVFAVHAHRLSGGDSHTLVGMDGIFTFAGALSLAAIWMTLFVVPAEPRGGGDPPPRARSGALRETLRNPEQLRLNLGIFSLHVVQMAIFVVIPAAFVRYGGLAVTEHWKIYLPVVIGSFVLMAPPLIQAERRGRLKFLFISAILLLLAVELGFAVCYTNFQMAVTLLLAFFVAFNILEAALPSLVSRIV